MAFAQIAEFDVLRSLAYTGISATYAVLGGAFQHPARLICITNNTDGDMFFSDNGTQDKLFVAANSFKLFDITTNRAGMLNDFLCLIKYTQFSVRYSTVPTKGAVYLEVIYGIGD